MMAYIDENGNITGTPSIRLKQKPVQADQIQVAVPKRIHNPDDQLDRGPISFFNTAKGYGFIRDDNTRENIFFHVNSLTFDAKENDKVTFSTGKGLKGINAVKRLLRHKAKS